MVISYDGCGGRHQRPQRFSISCWNMRTLIESDGSIATGMSRQGSRGVAVDRKAMLLVQELRKFRMSAVGISETKWFGSAVYDVDGFLILHSGRPVPGKSEKGERNEGVGIVMDPCMGESWKECGEVWNPVSSRIVSARLRICDNAAGRSPRGRRGPVFGVVVSVYAPTHRASQVDKDKFYADLQSVVDGVSTEDVLLIVGDFNTRVGSGKVGGDEWEGVRGKHGVGLMNEDGEALLSWCSLNGLVVLNTVFEKKKIHKYTWQHPGNKQWHCIDYIIMRQGQRHMCSDVTVLRTADCWTDHMLVRGQLRFYRPVKKPRITVRKRFAVGALKDEKVCESFREKVCGNVESHWDSGINGIEKWEVIRDGFVGAAKSVLGWESRRQPDWFKENAPVLKELIDKRNCSVW